MTTKIAIITFLILICFGCSESKDQNSNENKTSQKTKLPSGKEIKINNIGGMKFENGETALVLNYETDISIENLEELKKEVTEVWKTFRYDVEREKTTFGIIRASHFEGSGFYRKGKGYGFIFKKGEDGNWELDDKKF